MHPIVSIIVPCYNTSSTIQRCVESVIIQTNISWELILVDDGSKDETGVICDRYSSQDTRIKVIHKTNGGVSSARNTGLRNATGDYVMFLDSDDYLHKDCLLLIQNEDVDILFFGIKLVGDGYTRNWYDTPSLVAKNDEEKRKLLQQYLTTDMFRSPCGKFFRREIAVQYSFNEKMKLGEDTDYVLRVVKNCTDFVSYNKYYYMCEDHSVVFSEKYKMHPGDSAYNLRQIINSYRELAVSFDEFERLMFKIFFSVVDIKRDKKEWYQDSIVQQLEKKYLFTFEPPFRDKYNFIKNSENRFLNYFFQLLFTSPTKCIKYIDYTGSLGLIRPLVLQKLFYKIKNK